MLTKIKTINNYLQDYLIKAKNIKDLEDLRIELLGKKGKITDLLKELGSSSLETKKTAGPLLNQLKDQISQKISEKKLEFNQQEIQKKLSLEKIDITLPSKKNAFGKKHPISIVTDEVVNIFRQLGFSVAEGPEAEVDYYNFEALNFPKDHPSRDMHDTFYLDTTAKNLLRTHTSNVQIHIMEKYSPPVKVVMPGKVYRSDADLSHSPVFHQIEGLYVDKNVNFGNLIAVLTHFTDSFFKTGSKIRIRPSYFPFTEPSVEIDVECVICKGKGCGVCKNTGWIEVLGAGMVDPNVLNNVKINTNEFSGFAFGVGIERLAILKYGIDNIKLFYDNHKFFLEQF